MVYEFLLYPINATSKTVPTRVWTDDPHYMRTFLLQHGVDPQLAKVKVFDIPAYSESPINDKTGAYKLNKYHFGSRQDKTIHPVITTESIMYSIATNVAIDLSSVMSLGSAALRGDIQIFEHIAKLVSSLDPIYIKDSYVADAGCDADYRLERLADLVSDYPYYESIAMSINEDDSFLYDSLYDSISPNVVQHITLESYVSIFTKLYIIGHNDYDKPEGDEFDV